MTKKTKATKPKSNKRPMRRGVASEATVDEFEREGMGIAAKE
jgi:hypothetical protein